MPGSPRRNLALAHAFTTSASRYWLGVFPEVHREVRGWRERAQLIPNPVLRRLALLTHRAERGNLEGAAAFAVLAAGDRRSHVVRAAVSFQALYDYVDTLAEQPSADPMANGHQLHLALLAALDPSIDHGDYYHYAGNRDDGDYLISMVANCRRACAALPSYPVARPAALRAARRMVSYQAFTHCRQQPGRGRELAAWALSITPPGEDLEWWESAAGAASSLGVFALISQAARPGVRAQEIRLLETAYFPWIGALHVLLDSLIDRAADLRCGHHSLVAHYADEELQARRLGAIAGRAVRAAEAAPQGDQHAAILAAMISFYLSAPGAQTDPAAALAAEHVLERLGTLALPAMTVLKARRAVGRALTCRLAVRS